MMDWKRSIVKLINSNISIRYVQSVTGTDLQRGYLLKNELDLILSLINLLFCVTLILQLYPNQCALFWKSE